MKQWRDHEVEQEVSREGRSRLKLFLSSAVLLVNFSLRSRLALLKEHYYGSKVNML